MHLTLGPNIFFMTETTHSAKIEKLTRVKVEEKINLKTTIKNNDNLVMLLHSTISRKPGISQTRGFRTRLKLLPSVICYSLSLAR